jgi:hypothetical protein
MTSGFLPLAEEAVLRDPGSADILMLAATAALLDNQPDRAQVFLKRYFKRYIPEAPYHLLYALALESQNKLILARAVLENHGLTDQLTAFYAFPGGWARREWLNKRLANILGRDGKSARKGAASPAGQTAVMPSSKTAPKAAPKAAAKSAPKVPAKPALKIVQAASTTAPSSQPSLPAAAAAETALPALPRIEIDIPFVAEFDLAPLENAAACPPEIDGAHPGIAGRAMARRTLDQLRYRLRQHP